MSAEETVRNAARAQVLRSEHEAVKGEIDAREVNFQDIAENLAAMEQTGVCYTTIIIFFFCGYRLIMSFELNNPKTYRL